MRYVLTLIAGLVLGGLLVFAFVVVRPNTKPFTSSPVQAPDPAGNPPGTVVLTFDEPFFDALLTSIFRDLNAPKFPLRVNLNRLEALPEDANREAQFIRVQNCPSEIVLAPEGNQTRTGVRFADGKITAPLAFSGSASPLGACLNFRGIAQANINLFFNKERQTLDGQIDVEGVTLDGVLPIVSGLVTTYVRSAINERVNPLQLLNARQLALNVPVQASGGTLRAQIKDVRSEIKDNTLRLYVTYDFSGARAESPTQPQT